MELKNEIGEILSSNPSVLTLLWNVEKGWRVAGTGGHPVDEAKIKENGLEGIKDIVREEDRTLFRAFLEKIEYAKNKKETAVSEKENFLKSAIHLQNSDGTFGYYGMECYFQRDESGFVHRMLVRFPELAAEDVYRIQLAHTITNDKNPAFFTQGAKDIIERHPDWNFAMVQFDVAKFKMINEQYGEAFGDEMLEYFINTLKLLCNKDQLYTRLTADVFMILTPYETHESLLEFIDYLYENLSGYKEIAYRLVFGACKVENGDKNLRKYGDGAALARQSIKDDVLTHVAFYKDEMKRTARMNKFIEDHMEDALERGQFVMYLQPKYSISRERIIGAEALVRWVHPEYGVIPPMEFVPLFEKNGFIIRMDEYIWEEACKTIREWIDKGVEPIPISVNVSRRHLKDNAFVGVLNHLVEKYDIPKHLLEVEITETIESDLVKEGVRMLKNNGYTLLMDDFGSGYSSLNMLKDTQFDVIKIDRAFLRDFIGSERGRRIVEHTIRMTKEIGLDLIAEGVETKEQALFLSQCGCDMAQGFYYARPMTLADFNKKYPQEDKG